MTLKTSFMKKPIKYQKDSYSHKAFYRDDRHDKEIHEDMKLKSKLPDPLSAMVRCKDPVESSPKIWVKDEYRRSSTANLIRFLSILDPVHDKVDRDQVMAVLSWRRSKTKVRMPKTGNGTKKRPSRVHPMPKARDYITSFKASASHLPVNPHSVSTLEERMGIKQVPRIK